VTWAKYKLKGYAWKAALILAVVSLLGYYLYRILKPGVNKSTVADKIVTEMKLAVKENELRAELEKDKIGAIKGIFNARLRQTKKIDNREERLKALIDLHKELDI